MMKNLLLIAALAVALTLAGCAQGANSAGSGDSGSAKSSSLSDGDVGIIAGLEVHSTRWNKTVAPIVTDYNDPTIGAATWVAETGPKLRDLQGIIMTLDSEVLGISDADVRGVFSFPVENYKEKLAALTALVNSVGVGDKSGEQKALTELQKAAAAGREWGLNLLDELRPFVDPDELARQLKEKGASLAKLGG